MINSSSARFYWLFGASYCLILLMSLTDGVIIILIIKIFLRYFNFEPSFKLRWCRARGLFGSEIPVTTRGFELRISCIWSSYLTHQAIRKAFSLTKQQAIYLTLASLIYPVTKAIWIQEIDMEIFIGKWRNYLNKIHCIAEVPEELKKYFSSQEIQCLLATRVYQKYI